MATTSPSSRAPALTTTDGHVWSWAELVTEYGPAIESYARSRGIPEAADVAQDVFADVVDRLPTFTGGRAELRSFLFTVAHRRIADRHRRAYRRPGIDVRCAPAHATPEDACIALDDAAAAMRALNELDERSRRVLLLRFIDERDTAEIAAAMRLSTTNVRAIQSRALRRVRGILEKSRHNPVRRAMALLVVPLFDRLRRRDAQAAEPSGVASAGQPTVMATASTATATTTVASAATGVPLMNMFTAAVLAAAAAVGTGTAIAAADAPPAQPIEAGVSTAAKASLEVAASQHGATTSDVDARIDADVDADVAVDAGADVALEGDVDGDVAVEATVPSVAVDADADVDVDAEADVTVAVDADADADAAVDGAASVAAQAGAGVHGAVDAAADVDTDVDADVKADVDAAVDVAAAVDVTVPAVTVPAVTVPAVTVPAVTLPAAPTVGADAGADVGANVAAAAQAGAGIASGVVGGIATNGASSITLGG